MAEPVVADVLRSFVGLASDIREVYAEAKGHGFDTKVLRKVIALRKLDAAERREQEAILALYMDALGMLADTPLGRAAIDRATAAKPAGKRKRGRSFADEVGDRIEEMFKGRPGVAVERNARL